MQFISHSKETKALTKEIESNKKQNEFFFLSVLSEKDTKWYLIIARVIDLSFIELRILSLFNFKGTRVYIMGKEWNQFKLFFHWVL